ncbi:MAG: hypothetical protein SVW77_01615 [Candidatus Nanohaloarchaea archaeon]|nr:hypothetical protein [Candidatus Nanohaloarchaea archaeon]
MKPLVTFLTSSELQEALGEPLADEEAEELQRFRDRLLESFGNLEEALEEMEDIYGRGWKTFDVEVYVVDGNLESVSAPILLRQKEIQATVFETFWMLAKLFIRDDPPDSELVDEGYGKLDAVSALLASAALERVMEEDGYAELEEAARSDTEELKTWRKVDELAERWDPETTPLYDWLEAQ